MSLEHLLETYGYPALFVGTFLEGETPLLMASFLAHRGYFSLPTVVWVAFAGSFLADQLFFQLGRLRGRSFLESRPAWQPKAARVSDLFERHGVPLLIGFRFLYGLRTVTPFIAGMSGVPVARFVLLNAMGGILWSLAFGTLGYSMGGLLTLLMGDLRRHEASVLVGILFVSALVWAGVLVRRARARRTREGVGDRA